MEKEKPGVMRYTTCRKIPFYGMVYLVLVR